MSTVNAFVVLVATLAAASVCVACAVYVPCASVALVDQVAPKRVTFSVCWSVLDLLDRARTCLAIFTPIRVLPAGLLQAGEDLVVLNAAIGPQQLADAGHAGTVGPCDQLVGEAQDPALRVRRLLRRRRCSTSQVSARLARIGW